MGVVQRTLIFSLMAILAVCVMAADGEKVSLDKDPHLMGWWKFDETAGNTAADSSAHNRKGTLSGELTFAENSAEGKVGKAVKLGAKDFVEIKGYKGVTGTKARTVTAWVKNKTRRGDLVVWGADDAGKQFRFGHIRGRLGITPFGGYFYMKEYTDDEKWHHVGVVVGEADYPNLHDDVTLYLDGDVATIDDIGLLDLLPIETQEDKDVKIGSGYEGLIDDLRIYDRPLTGKEVKAIFQGRSDKPLE